jgi:alpha-D-xyloside xylohydrolase
VTTTIPATTGQDAAVFVTSRQAGSIRVEATGAPGAWRVLLVGAGSPASTAGGEAVPDEQGTLISATGDALVITLEQDP